VSEETLRLVRDLLEAWNVHDVKRLKTFYVPAYEGVDVGQAQPQSGPQGVTRLVKRYLQATLIYVSLTRTSSRATGPSSSGKPTARTEELIRILPTGRDIAVRGTSLLTIENGKVTRGLYIWDAAGLLRSIGVLPEL
jgi:hypothetical protein